MSRFVVLEGLDGSGTTTQVARIAAHLSAAGHAVLAEREPTDGPIGRIIRSTLRGDDGAPDVHTLPWMFAADRADHLWRTVEPALAGGSWVVCDRYYHSSLAYQSLTLPIEEVLALNATFRRPALTAFLSVPVDLCLERIQTRGGELEIYESREHLSLVAEQYRRVLDLLWARGEAIAEIDGVGTPDEVTARILAAIQASGIA